MNKTKHILAIFIVLAVIAATAYLLPKMDLGDLLPQKDTQEATLADSTAVQDTLPFIDQMKAELEVIQAQYSKRKQRDVWTLGRGRTIIYYLLQAQKILEKNGGKVLFMEELFNDNNAFQSANLDAIAPNGDTLLLNLQISSNVFRDNASYLSIAFQVRTLTPEIIVALNSLDFPYDLLVTPFGQPESFYPDLDRIKNKEVVLWLVMESERLDKRFTRTRPIRSYHTEEQISGIISDSKTLIPSASGIATRFAEHAVDHRPLLEAVLNAAKKNKLWFADMSLNNKSKVMEICPKFNISCKILAPYNPDNSSLDDYIHQKLRGAARNGMGAMILPLSPESIAKVKTMKEKTATQGTTIINLSTFMNTNKELP